MPHKDASDVGAAQVVGVNSSHLDSILVGAGVLSGKAVAPILIQGTGDMSGRQQSILSETRIPNGNG